MIPVKGEEPGAFIITDRDTREKFVMSERTLKQVIATMGENTFNRYFIGEWVVSNEQERKLAEEIKRGMRQ